MTHKKTELDELMIEISRKANKKLSKIIVNLAIKKGVNIKYIEENYPSFVSKQREKLIKEEKEKHKDEIKALTLKLERTNKKVECIKKETKPQFSSKPTLEVVKSLDENKGVETLKQPFKKKKNTKSEFGFTQEEMDFMAQEYIYNHKDYRTIAKILNKDETKVRKQIAHLMSELVA